MSSSFFPVSLQECARILEAELIVPEKSRADTKWKEIRLEDVSDLETAGPHDLVILWESFKSIDLGRIKPGCICVEKGNRPEKNPKVPLLVVDDLGEATYRLYEQIIARFLWSRERYEPSDYREGFIHPTAWVHPDVELGRGVRIGAYTVISGQVKIGDGVEIEHHVAILPRVSIGRGCYIKTGAVLGTQGFKFFPGSMRHTKVYHLGRVDIGEDVEIGAHTCIDRAVTGVTYIGDGTKVDNLVQIAHNVRMGRLDLIAAQTGIAGSASIGDDVWMGGQVGIADHAQVGHHVRIAGQSGIMGTVEEHAVLAGSPALPHRLWLRIWASLPKLPDLIRTLRKNNKRKE